MVGQDADSPIGVIVVGDMDPQGGAASTGIPEVELDGVGVVGDGTGDTLGEAAVGLEPLPLSRICWLV